MTDPDLAWRAEEACLAAWPAPQEVLMDGWLLRFGGGHTSRANSINVIGSSRRDAASKLDACRALYRAQGLRPIIRLSTVSRRPDLAPALDDAGYGAPREPSRVLFAAIAAPSREDRAVRIAEGPPDAGWRAASAALSGLDAAGAALRDRILGGFAVPVAVASLEIEGAVAAVALGAIHGGLVCLNAVATDPAFRGRGFAGRTVSALLAWAAGRGAAGACLQVMDDNAAALALYRGLGFTAELSRYHYRDGPPP